jgi:hypothetical protein
MDQVAILTVDHAPGERIRRFFEILYDAHHDVVVINV